MLFAQSCWNGCSDCECNHDTVHGGQPPPPPPYVVRLALIVISLPNRRLPQAITPVGARTRLAAAARLSSAPPSSKVRLSPNSLARVRYVNVLHNSLLDQGGGWDGTFYYKSANPPPLTLLQACLHASFHASFLPLMPLSPISCCSFLSFLKSSPYWSSVGGIAAGPPLSTFFVACSIFVHFAQTLRRNTYKVQRVKSSRSRPAATCTSRFIPLSPASCNIEK